jgi:hypothetical protein
MLAGIIVLAILAAGLVLLIWIEDRDGRRVDLASELQVPGSAQVRAAYDRAFRTRTWPSKPDVVVGRQRTFETDVRAA